MDFQILEIDEPRWLSYYQRLDEMSRDVFYSPGFAKVCQKTIHKRDRVRCASFVGDEGVLLYPFVERELLPVGSRTLRDITGLYGRGGIASTLQNRETVLRFYEGLQSYCRSHDIICGFDRFHPVTNNHLHISPQTESFETGKFVTVPLEASIEKIESQFRHDIRKSIKKAERAEVQVFHKRDLSSLDEYLRIYHATLDRRGAESFYYFPKEFYQYLQEELPQNFVFFFAEYKGELVSCELVLCEGIYSHSYLGGTLWEYKDICPNALLKREIIRYFKEQKGKYFLLGGGPSMQDGIFRYKSGFSPEGITNAYVGGTIYDSQAYDQLKKNLTTADLATHKNRFQFYDPYFLDAKWVRRAASICDNL